MDQQRERERERKATRALNATHSFSQELERMKGLKLHYDENTETGMKRVRVALKERERERERDGVCLCKAKYDQIWCNFATSAIFFKASFNFKRLFSVWHNFEPTLANRLCY